MIWLYRSRRPTFILRMVADLTASAARTILKTCLRCFDAIFRRAEAGPGRAEAWAGRAEAQNGGFLIWSKTCVSAEAIATFFCPIPSSLQVQQRPPSSPQEQEQLQVLPVDLCNEFFSLVIENRVRHSFRQRERIPVAVELPRRPRSTLIKTREREREIEREKKRERDIER